MDTILVKKLISHDINCTELLADNVWPNCLKEGEFEWNKEENSRHQFSEDIANSDLVMTMEDVDEPYEAYAYFFFDIKSLEAGNKAYFLKKGIFDEKLPDSFIGYCIDAILGIIATKDNLTIDRICIGKNESYPLSQAYIDDTKQKLSIEILKRYHLAKTEMVADDDFKNR